MVDSVKTRLALEEECTAIERELRMTTCRDDFDFRSKWAVSVDDVMRALNELKPTVIHFSGHAWVDVCPNNVNYQQHTTVPASSQRLAFSCKTNSASRST